ncbi:MAG: UDP-glucose/GDP-mannose dehydrogenase family protein [Colwellia sp.]|nr:UDP-glucose/GDP-mannose dehydrogenase family protein [Colwellia sp.]
MNISIFGLGYVGCVSVGCLAKNGHNVTGVDLSPVKVDFINQGKPTIVENEIDEIISEQHNQGKISATNDGVQAVRNTDVSFICVGTPSTPNGHLDLTAIHSVAGEIGRGIKEKDSFHVVAIRSTVLPGTNMKVTEIIEDISGKKRDKDFAVVSNPEFLREGSAVKDYFQPSFTLIGTGSDMAMERMRSVYDGVGAPIISTGIEIAELIKYVNNGFHALKITFANEIGAICDKLGMDSHKLMEIFCLDNKLNISAAYLKPGFAYGGSCLPKDLKALRIIAHDNYLECPVIENIEKSNELQKKNILNRIMDFNKERIGFLGLSFKEGTDDLRNSPIIDIIEQLLGKGFDIKIYDRNVRLSQLIGANREYVLDKIPFISKFIVDDTSELIEYSEVIIVVNREAEFAEILKRVPKEKGIYDLVNIDLEGKNNMENYIGVAW